MLKETEYFSEEKSSASPRGLPADITEAGGQCMGAAERKKQGLPADITEAGGQRMGAAERKKQGLPAHITEAGGVRAEQSLKEHCFQTAEYAAESIGSAGFQNVVRLAGILHDMGKGKEEFSEYLEAAWRGEPVKRGSVNHTFSSVIYLLEKYHAHADRDWENLASELISFVTGSHHGIFNCTDLDGRNGFRHRLEADRFELHHAEAAANFFSEVISEESVDALFQKASGEVKKFFSEAADTYGKNPEKIFFQIGMLARMALSAVIYGDRRDTGEFMRQRRSAGPQETDWDRYVQFFEQKILSFRADSELNRVRSDISAQCRLAAERPGGIYRLDVPTGAGKTLCTLRFALTHAREHKKRRIIFIIPLLSVLDQNVKVIKDYVPDPRAVLEHHSNVLRGAAGSRQKEGSNGAGAAEELDPFELLAESWNAPVVVSTLVQLLNILFSHQTQAIARMQALCDSVIIIDEVQSLPKKTTLMFNMALNFLQQFCGATIVLSSATQPCFDELRWPLRLAPDPDMVKLSEAQRRVFRRTRIIDRTGFPGMDPDECAAFCASLMKEHASLLLVCNTKEEARTLSEKLKVYADLEGWDISHLSTSMCQRHRLCEMEKLRRRLAYIQEAVRSGRRPRRLICVSTQLIEAGVDLSFQCAVRIMAGLDNLAQTAGRCNRSGEYGETGIVYLIRLRHEDLRMLREIENAKNSTQHVLERLDGAEGDSLIGGEAMREFYRNLYLETRSETEYPVKLKGYGTEIFLARLLSMWKGNAPDQRNRDYVLHQPFQLAGRLFQVFDEDTTDILVPYGDGEELIRQMQEIPPGRFDFERYRELLERAKPYTVSVYEWQRKRLDENGLLIPILEGRILALKPGVYHERYGLAGRTEEQPVDNFIL